MRFHAGNRTEYDVQSSAVRGRGSAHLGLDVGAASLVIVLVDGSGRIIDSEYCLMRERSNMQSPVRQGGCGKSCEACASPCNGTFITQEVERFIQSCREKHDVSISSFGATGSQIRKSVTFPIPLDVFVSEVSAHARGMRRATNTADVQAIIDVGGQDSKVIRLSNPRDFYMSGLCAAGTGAYLDEIARVENITVSDFGQIGGKYIANYILSLGTRRPMHIEEFSSVCTVFTKSSYVKKKSQLTLDQRAAAICWAQGKQIYNTVIHNLRDYRGEIAFQGGVSFNGGVRLALDYFLKEGLDLADDFGSVIVIPEIDDYRDEMGRKKPVSHLMGALGAALLGREYVETSHGSEPAVTICPPLRSSEKRKNFLKSQISLAHGKGEKKPRVAWCGTIFPSEICYLFDIIPISLPVLAAIDHRNAKDNLLTAARKEGLERASCTVLSSVMGRLDRTPPPDFILHTSGSCDYYRQHMLRLVEEAGDRFGIDTEKQVCSIDLPTFSYDQAASVGYVADQLRESVAKIEDVLGEKHDPRKLRAIIDNVNEARHYHLIAEDLRARNPALALGSDLLKRAMLYSSGWGTRELVDISKLCAEEMEERVRSLNASADPIFNQGEKHRVMWLSLWDYTSPYHFNLLEGELNCAIVAEELNHIHWQPIDGDKPFEGIAGRIMQPINHVKSRMNYLMEMAERYRVDGIIFFVHFFAHCPLGSETIQNMLRKSRYPVLFLEGDCVDKARRPSSTITKMQAFVEQLNDMKYGNIFGVPARKEVLARS